MGVYSTQWAYAQLAVTTATLTGAVTDPSGSVVSEAKVTVKSSEIGVTRIYTTSAQGFYSFTQLPPSTYQLEVQAKGFSSYLQNGISLDAGQSASQNVTLAIGSVTQQVVVTTEAPLINNTNANIGAEVDSEQIVELPLNDRNIYGLIGLNSSVQTGNLYQTVLGGTGNTTDDADQDVTFLNFAGGYFGTSAYMLDGTWDTALNSWGGAIYVPSVDDTQEFKIQTNTFTTQYGWSTGNVVDVTTKSGTSSYHGDAYEFYRNGAMDANLWFSDHNGLPKQSLTRNQVGASFGGPLQIPHLYKQRDKTYFFGLFEHFSVNSPSIDIFTVPDNNMRAGKFLELLSSQVGTDALGRPIYSGQIYDPRSGRPITAGAVDPKTGLVATETGYIRDPIKNNDLTALGPFDSLGASLLTYYPTPTSPGLANNLALNGEAPAASNEYTMRVDQNIGQATRFFTRYSYKSEYKTGEPEFYGASDPANLGEIVGDSRWDLVSGYSHAFNQNFAMNIHAGVENWHEHNGIPSLGFLPSTIGFPAYLDTARQFPQMTIGPESQLGHSGDALYIHGPTTTVAVDFTKLAGAHTVSLGFMGVNLQSGTVAQYSNSINILGKFTCGPDPTLCTANTGNAVAQTLLGLPDSGSTGVASNPSNTFHYYGWYLQDDWRALPKLTLNLGLRYDIQGAPTVHHNLGASFNTDLVNPIGTEIGGKMGVLMGALQFLTPNDRGVYDTVYGNWSPRVGFNYQVLPTLTVRGGYGIFFTPSVNGANDNNDGYGATSSIVSSTNAGVNPIPGLSLENPWPNGYVVPAGNSLGPLQDVGYGTGGIFRYHPSGYVQDYLFGLQEALSRNDSLELDYFGNHGVRMLTGSMSHSQVHPTYLSTYTRAQLNTQVPNPFYGLIAPGQSGCGMDQPTIVQSHLLQPYPQYCSVSENVAPVGSSLYNALEATYNHRFHNGLSVLVSYTFSKFLDNVEGAQNWAVNGNSSPANNYDLAAEKSVDGSDTPQSLVVSYIYDLPIGKGKAIGSGFNRKTDAVLGGWEISGIVSSRSGVPDYVNGNNWNSYGGSPRPDVVGSTKSPHQSINEWFNTGAFAYAPYGSFGNAPRFFSHMRSPDYNNFDTGIMKNWNLHRETRIQFRAEMFNTFNHPNFYTPNGSYNGCDPNSDTNCPSGFGQITNAFPARQVQMSGKFYW
jgi:hypothetical protein